MDADALYRCLQEEPRDARWLLKKVGPDYKRKIDGLQTSGRPIDVKMEIVAGQNRAVYRAASQGHLFESPSA